MILENCLGSASPEEDNEMRIQYRMAPERNLWRKEVRRARQKTSEGTTSGKIPNSVLSCRRALESKFYPSVYPNRRQVCWAFKTCARLSLVRAIFEDMQTLREGCWPAMHAVTMAPVAQGQSSKKNQSASLQGPSTLKTGNGHAETVRGIWGDLPSTDNVCSHIIAFSVLNRKDKNMINHWYVLSKARSFRRKKP